MIPDWAQRLPTLWLVPRIGLDPRMPAGGVQVTVDQAHRLIGGAPPAPEVARAWLEGADVRCPDDASEDVCALAERLQAILPERCRPLAEGIAKTLGLPRAGVALSRAPTMLDARALADAVMDIHPDGAARLGAEARLLRALIAL